MSLEDDLVVLHRESLCDPECWLKKARHLIEVATPST